VVGGVSSSKHYAKISFYSSCATRTSDALNASNLSTYSMEAIIGARVEIFVNIRFADTPCTVTCDAQVTWIGVADALAIVAESKALLYVHIHAVGTVPGGMLVSVSSTEAYGM
jgi:hypothetical protein